MVLPLPLGPVMAIRISETKLAARDDDGRAADLNALDRLRGAVDSCVERRGAADLRALRDLDLVAERDAAVPYEMQRERAGGRAGRGILRHAERRPEHARLPAQAVPGEAVDPVRADRSEPLLVWLQRGDILRRGQSDVHVAQAVVVHLDRKLRLDPEDGLQLVRSLEGRDGRQWLLHPSEDDPRTLALDAHRHGAA